ncbi:MAG: glycosyltransferase family 4 protein [Chloroflexi bacterium]|nr:glycosyltransferase family 4 protein [Chloroflexota bacterium]
MRVALIGPVPPHMGGMTPGGVATHQVHLADGLAAAGVETALLATNTSVSPGCWRAPKNSAAYGLYRVVAQTRSVPARVQAYGGAVSVLRYLPRVMRMRRVGSRAEVLRNALAYRRFLVEVRPDLVHVQHPLERCLYARMVRRIEGWRLPLVVTAHSLFGEHAEPTIHQLMAPNLRAAERVIAVSDHIADQSIALGVDAKRVRVIRSGVDTHRFQPRDRSAARRRLRISFEAAVVLFVGNLEPRKQVDVLLRAVAQVRKQIAAARLLVVGSGESAGAEDQTARLVRLTTDLGLGDAVEFMGQLSEDELLDAYAAADMFALASSSEAQGIVALEAMACGLPVVATEVGGLPATIDEGRTGFLVPPGDVAALAQRILGVLLEPERAAAIGAAARHEVEQRFSWKRAVEATLEVYREVLD